MGCTTSSTVVDKKDINDLTYADSSYADSSYANLTYANTKEEELNFDKGKVVKVVDGDTVWIVFKNNEVFHRYKLRIAKINAYELKDADNNKKKLALEGKEYLTKLILNRIVDVKLNPKKDKYGRLLGQIKVNGNDVGELMIKKGLAVDFMV